jgi:hypothetical protein
MAITNERSTRDKKQLVRKRRMINRGAELDRRRVHRPKATAMDELRTCMVSTSLRAKKGRSPRTTDISIFNVTMHMHFSPHELLNSDMRREGQQQSERLFRFNVTLNRINLCQTQSHRDRTRYFRLLYAHSPFKASLSRFFRAIHRSRPNEKILRAE